MLTLQKTTHRCPLRKGAAVFYRIRYNPNIHSKHLQQLGTILLVVAILVAAVGLISRAWYEVSSGVLHSDAQIFQTVARGMLHGLQPYADLFETKPPGIFLVHAVSLKLFGSQFLVKLLQAIALLGIPVLVAMPAIAIAQDRSAAQRRLISLTSILFGLLLALFAANQAGEGLTESYGAFFALMALAITASGKWIEESGKKMKGIFAIGLLMLFSVGIKEPFLMIILAGVILLQKDLLTSFIYPLCVAMGLGLIALLALGIAVPFFQIYLPHMLGYHISQYHGSAFLRALEVWRVVLNFGAYSWWLAFGVLLLWIYVGYRSLKSHSLVRWFVGSYLMFIAIAIGGDFYGHHFVFAVPLYAVMWWICVRQKMHLWTIAPVFILAALFNTQLSYATQHSAWEDQERELKRVATVVDGVMERCGWEKFLQMIPRGGGPYAYMDHSPYGPIFIHYSRFIGANMMYQNAYIRALNDAPVALVLDIDDSNFTQYTLEYVRSHFAGTAPECVGEDYEDPLPFHLLFRKS